MTLNRGVIFKSLQSKLSKFVKHVGHLIKGYELPQLNKWHCSVELNWWLKDLKQVMILHPFM